MKKLIKLNVFNHYESVNEGNSIRKNIRRVLAFPALLILGSVLTQLNGQTVTYNYDASGNVISKIVVKAQSTSNFDIKKNTLPSWGSFLAYSTFNAFPASIRTSNTLLQEPEKSSKKAKTDPIKEKTSVSNVGEQPQIVVAKKNENKPN